MRMPCRPPRAGATAEPVGVEDGVVLLLPAVAVEALAEVAGLVEQADADDRDADVGGRLEVVAGEDAEAAGVLRQGAAMPNSALK